MLLKNNFFYYLIIFFFNLNVSYAEYIKNFDKVYEIFKKDLTDDVLILLNSKHKNFNEEQGILINNQLYKKGSDFIYHDLKINEKKIFNTLYYLDVSNLNSFDHDYLPINFSESYNPHWSLIELNDNFDINNLNLIRHFINYFKMKFRMNSEYIYLPNQSYISNNFSNIFLINNTGINERSFLIYYKKGFVIQIFWICLILLSPLIIYFSIYLNKTKK